MSALPSTEKDVADLLAQQERLTLPSFSYEDAWELGSLLVRMAREREAPVAIGVRCGSRRLFHAALPGSSADNDAWLERKSRVVERYGESSLLVGTRFRVKGGSFEASSRLDPGRYAAHGGAFPLTVAAVAGVVGTVAVSGLPQTEDHALVTEALERFRDGERAG